VATEGHPYEWKLVALIDPSSLDHAAEIISRGGVIAFRTDTFYGLGANPFDETAVRRIKELKGRDDGKPILIVISDLDQVERFMTERSPQFVSLSERFWPGPLTLIGIARPDVPSEITAGTATIGIRLPDDEDVRSLVRACGGALTATSANLAARPPATTAREVFDYFSAGIDLTIDGGEAQTDRPSTVVDVSGRTTKVIREGIISRKQIEAALGEARP
jgi:L-threonylcarbamoyladenylate synthase